MRLEINSPAAPGAGGSRESCNPARWAPGNIIRARILSHLPDGKTLLQIGATKVLAAHSISGQTGDLLFFEVQPAPQSAASTDTAQTRLVLRLVGDTRGVKHVTGGTTPPGKSPSAPIGTRRRSSATTYPQRSLIPDVGPDPVNSIRHEFIALRLMGSIASLGNRWIQQFAKRVLARPAKKTTTAKLSMPLASQQKRRLPAAGFEPARIRGPLDNRDLFDYTAGFEFKNASDRSRLVKIGLKSLTRNPADADSGRILTASLILNLEHTGEIGVELKMDDDTIWVDFKTAETSICHAIEANRNALGNALKVLGRNVFCQARVDRQPFGEDRGGVDAPQNAPREIELNI